MAELIPQEGSPGVGDAVAKMLDEILSYREELKIAEKFTRWHKLRRNEHWKYKNKEMTLASANMLGSHHQKTCNMLTDNNPTFNAVPGGELGEDAKDQLSLLVNVTDSWWNDTEQQEIFGESVFVGELYGAVGEYNYYDVDSNFPYGDVATDTLDPLYFSLYPPKCRKVKKAEAFLRWYPLTVREAQRKWPDSADLIKGDLSLLEKIGDERNEESIQQPQSRIQVIISTLTRFIGGEDKKRRDVETDELFIIEAWAKDYSENEDGSPVYPGNIRRVTVCNGGGVVLDDVKNPSLNWELDQETLMNNYLFSRFPLSFIQPVSDPSTPFGISDYEQLEKLNIEFNKSLTQFTRFKDKASRVKLKNPRNSGIPDDELDTESGIIHPTNHLISDAIQYINPPQMGTDIYNGISLYKDLFNEIAGSFNDVMQGQKQGSEVVAAKAIAMLLEEASRMARGKIRNYSKMLRERGRRFLALAQMWYDTPRIVTFQRQGEDVSLPVDRETLRIQGKINVVSGSTMPVSDIQRREEVLSLAHGGLVDQEYVLEKFNIDNYNDIIDRMQKGPIGKFIESLAGVGVPPPVLQYLQQISQVDPKETQKAIEMGKLPNFMQLLQQLMGQQQPDFNGMIQQAGVQKAMAEAKKAEIEAEKAIEEIKKIAAEIAEKQATIKERETQSEYNLARAQSEYVDQEVKKAGILFDEEEMIIRKAEAVSGIKSKHAERRNSHVKTVSEIAKNLDQKTGPYKERGVRSNNEDI